MGLLSIFDNIEFKGNKVNIILKWVIGVAGSAVVGAFTIGALKTNVFNKLDTVVANQTELKTEMKNGFNALNTKIDVMYQTGLEGFEKYRIFNNQQLELIIEFGQSNEEVNQDLLKRMLAMNSAEKAQQIENQIEQARRITPVVADKPIEKKSNLPSQMVITNVETGKSTYFIDGATENYLDTLNLVKYEITEKKKSDRYEGLFNFTYIDKED